MNIFYWKRKNYTVEEQLQSLNFLIIFILSLITIINIIGILFSLLTPKKIYDIPGSEKKTNVHSIEEEVLKPLEVEVEKTKIINKVSKHSTTIEKDKSVLSSSHNAKKNGKETEEIDRIMSKTMKLNNKEKIIPNENISLFEEDEKIFEIIKKDIDREKENLKTDDKNNPEKEKVRLSSLHKMSKRQFAHMVMEIVFYKQEYYGDKNSDLISEKVISVIKEYYPVINITEEHLKIINQTINYIYYIKRKVEIVSYFNLISILEKIENKILLGFHYIESVEIIKYSKKVYFYVYITDADFEKIKNLLSPCYLVRDIKEKEKKINTLLIEMQRNLLNYKILEEMNLNKDKKIKLTLQTLKEFEVIDWLLSKESLFSSKESKKEEEMGLVAEENIEKDYMRKIVSAFEENMIIDDDFEDKPFTFSLFTENEEIKKIIDNYIAQEIEEEVGILKKNVNKQEKEKEKINILSILSQMSQRQFAYLIVQITYWKSKSYEKRGEALIKLIIDYMSKNFNFEKLPNQIKEKYLIAIGEVTNYISYIEEKMKRIDNLTITNKIKAIKKLKGGFNTIECDKKNNIVLYIYIDDKNKEIIRQFYLVDNKHYSKTFEQKEKISLLKKLQQSVLNPENLEEMKLNKQEEIRSKFKGLKKLEIVKLLLSNDSLLPIDINSENITKDNLKMTFGKLTSIPDENTLKQSEGDQKVIEELVKGIKEPNQTAPNKENPLNDNLSGDSNRIPIVELNQIELGNEANKNDKKTDSNKPNSNNEKDSQTEFVLEEKKDNDPLDKNPKTLEDTSSSNIEKSHQKINSSLPVPLIKLGQYSPLLLTKEQIVGIILDSPLLFENEKIYFNVKGQVRKNKLIDNTLLQFEKYPGIQKQYPLLFEDDKKKLTEMIEEVIEYLEEIEKKSSNIDSKAADNFIKQTEEELKIEKEKSQQKDIAEKIESIKLMNKEQKMENFDISKLSILLLRSRIRNNVKLEEVKETFSESQIIIFMMQRHLLKVNMLKIMKEKNKMPVNIAKLKIVKFLFENNDDTK